LTKDRIRVLYIVENTTFGGGERSFGQYSIGLNKDRFQTIIAAHAGGQLEEIIRRGGVRFFPVDMSRRINLKTVSRLSGLIEQDRIDIVHSKGARADFFARMACRKNPSVANICTVAMLVEGFDVNFLKKTTYKIADRYSARYVTHYIAVSKALKDILIEKRRISPNKISVIYNGVEMGHYSPDLCDRKEARHSLGIKDDSAVVGTIGRLVYQKGYSYFLKAAKLIHSRKKNVRFVIVGHGPEEENLKRLAESLGISQLCLFAGLRHDTARLMSAFDVFVLSSVLEGLPIIIIEAMAMGRPIVATNIEGVREELENNATGLLVPPAEPEALAEGVLALLDDRRKAEHLGREARKDAEFRFDLKDKLIEIEKLYKNILNSER
jgi:glycosyltransferase involved in cell wall biosynthesis